MEGLASTFNYHNQIQIKYAEELKRITLETLSLQKITTMLLSQRTILCMVTVALWLTKMQDQETMLIILSSLI